MKRRIYAVYDKTTQDLAHSGGTALAPHHAAAIRDFADAVLAPNSRLAQHPQDFALMYLGEIDTTTGYPITTALDRAEEIVTAAQVIEHAKRGDA